MTTPALQPKVYVDPETLFSIGVPAGWVLDNSGQHGSRVILFHPDAVRGFRPNVNVTAQPVGALTPEEFLTLGRLQLKQMTGLKKLDRDEPSPQMPGARMFEFSNPVNADLLLRARQLICFFGDFAYILTATAPEDVFPSYSAAFQETLNSFRFNR